MRVLLCTNYQRFSGGAESYFDNIISGLSQIGITTSSFYFAEQVVKNNLFHIPFLDKKVSHLEFEKFVAKVQLFRPDIIHFNKNIHFTIDQIRHVKEFEIPMVMSVHDHFSIPFFTNIKNVVKSFVLHYQRYVDQYIIPSRIFFDELKHQYGDIVSYIPHFVDISHHPRLPVKNASDKKLLFVGRVEENKGIFLLIKAFNLLHSKDNAYTLNIVGDGHSLQKAIKLANELNLSNAITFTGYIPQTSIIDYYLDASCLVIPTLQHELFGLVGIEAQACGLPVIANDLHCIREWCQDGETGIVFRKGDINDMVSKISLLLSDQYKYDIIRHKAFQMVSQKFNKQNSIDQLNLTYRKLIYEVSQSIA
jgi:glycosyltransferase involved in cell wall biosynthesis